MKSIAEILGDDKRGAMTAFAKAGIAAKFENARLYRGVLSVHWFAHVEVTAAHPSEVAELAVKHRRDAVLRFRTEPSCHRVECQVRTDPRDPESPLKWAEVVLAPIDPFDRNSPVTWQVKR